jgi:uncharacterized integral membrane protein
MRILKIIAGAFLFVACVFVATANMHSVSLVFPDVPIRGWPRLGPIEAPLFVVLLTALFLGVLITGLSTLLEQVRLRTIARRARKERDRAERSREEAERARDVAERERETLRSELDQARAEIAEVRVMVDRAASENAAVQNELASVRAERDALAHTGAPGGIASAHERTVGEGE